MPFSELYFNVDNGYLEGLVRGFKAGILSQADYLNLVQCETLEDLKLHLQSTDYGSFLANEASPLTVSVIDDKLKEKMVVEFRHMRNQSYEPLASFMDFITYSYMIDNVILLITGTLHQRAISELVPKCHPLGSFEQMEAVNIAQTPAELYNAILVDTPLAAFFQDCISEQDLDEMNIEIIRNTLYKAYLEAFYKFCSNLGGTTADTMCPILEFEADRRAFIITINSFADTYTDTHTDTHTDTYTDTHTDTHTDTKLQLKTQNKRITTYHVQVYYKPFSNEALVSLHPMNRSDSDHDGCFQARKPPAT